MADIPGWPPRWLTPVPTADLDRGDGDLYSDFAEAVCRVTKDSIAAPAGSLLRYRAWQRELNRHVLARRPDGQYRHRQALVGIARKNTKSTMGAGLGLGGLTLGPEGAEVYSVAADRLQAGVVFNVARRMVQLDPELSEELTVYRDVIEARKSGSIYRALSAEAYTKEGLNPTLVVFDEVHAQPNRELWDVMALAMGARVEPLMLGITTAGVRTDSTGADSLCYTLYQYGRMVATGEIDDPTFFTAWWEPLHADCDHRDLAAWREANPGLDDLVSLEDFESAVKKTPEPEFRTKRLNQWVNTMSAFLPTGAWEDCAGGEPLADGERVVLAFDGSFNGDSTALVAVRIAEVPYVEVVEAWEKPPGATNDWQVDIIEVEDTIRAACRRWNVLEVAADPFRWARSIQVLRAEGIPMEEFPQTPSRMTPATTRLYEAVMNRSITHDSDGRMIRHLGNAALKTDSRGSRLTKESKGSRRKIDLAVCAVMGVERAAWWWAEGRLSSVYEERGIRVL